MHLTFSRICFAILAVMLGIASTPVTRAEKPEIKSLERLLSEDNSDLDRLALQYLVLELAMGNHDPAHVDAYFGPKELEQAANTSQWELGEIFDRAARVNEKLAVLKLDNENDNQATRIKGLQERLRALTTRIQMAQGTHFPFDEESRLLFGATAPHFGKPHFEAILEKIGRLVPGEGNLESRVNAFREQFIIPTQRLPGVLDAAIAECRSRTLQHIDLPQDESFRVEYVTGRPWSGYNWYQGGFHSLIQINTELPIYIKRAVDLGCHEGYPGHHVYNALLEQKLVREKAWVEYTLYPLFSPQSLIAEGSANFGKSMAFNKRERIAFEKETLFPLAGLDKELADRYYALEELLDQLSYAGNEAARAYLDGEITAEQAQAWLRKYSLNTPEKAEQRIKFFNTYRSYVINYNLGRDLVRDWVQRGSPDEDIRWQRFTHLLSSPTSSADLQ